MLRRRMIKDVKEVKNKNKKLFLSLLAMGCVMTSVSFSSITYGQTDVVSIGFVKEQPVDPPVDPPKLPITIGKDNPGNNGSSGGYQYYQQPLAYSSSERKLLPQTNESNAMSRVLQLYGWSFLLMGLFLWLMKRQEKEEYDEA